MNRLNGRKDPRDIAQSVSIRSASAKPGTQLSIRTKFSPADGLQAEFDFMRWRSTDQGKPAARPILDRNAGDRIGERITRDGRSIVSIQRPSGS
jgi:hypothetical protein